MEGERMAGEIERDIVVPIKKKKREKIVKDYRG